MTGDSYKTYIVAIIVPKQGSLEEWAAKHSNDNVTFHVDIAGTIEELCNNPKVKEEVLRDLEQVGKKAGVHTM